MRLFEKLAKETANRKETPTQEVPRLRFKDLTSLSGSSALAKALKGTDADSRQIRDLAIKYLKENPDIGNVAVGKAPEKGDHYNWSENRIGLSTSNPDVFSHEAAHASRLHRDSLYRKMLYASKLTTSLGNMTSLPVLLGVGTSVSDSQKKKDIYGSLAGTTALAAIPNLYEEGRASASAIKKSPERWRTFKELAPGYASHAVNDLLTPVSYYLAKPGD